MIRPFLFLNSKVSPLLDKRPLNGPKTLVKPVESMREDGEDATTRYPPPRMTVPSGNENSIPLPTDQPERSTSTEFWLNNSTHSIAASFTGG